MFHTDLRLTFHPNGEADLVIGSTDLETVSGQDNLKQALILRLLSRQGELAALGHSRYGSRIHELIGLPLHSANLNLLRRYIRQAIIADPRVEEITKISVTPIKNFPGAVDIDIIVKPVQEETIQMGLTIAID